MKRTQRTPEERQSIISQFDALVKGGMHKKDAARKLGTWDTLINRWKKTATPKAKRPYKKRYQAIEIDTAPAAASTETIQLTARQLRDLIVAFGGHL